MRNLIIIIAIGLAISSCKKEIFIEYGEGLPAWTTETHRSDNPNYAVVFDQSKVSRIDLVFTSEN